MHIPFRRHSEQSKQDYQLPAPVENGTPQGAQPVVPRRRVKLLPLIIGIVLLALIILGGWWIFHAVTSKDSGSKKAPSSQQSSSSGNSGKPSTSTKDGTAPNGQSATPPSPEAAGGANAEGSTGSNGNSGTSAGSATDNTSSNSTGQLTNTGPGDVLVPFIAAVLFSGLLYEALLRQKLRD